MPIPEYFNSLKPNFLKENSIKKQIVYDNTK